MLDEPTAMLDPRGRAEVMNTIRRLNREKGITVVLITHYMDEAAQADRVVVMDDGHVVDGRHAPGGLSQVEKLRALGLTCPDTGSCSMSCARAAGTCPWMR